MTGRLERGVEYNSTIFDLYLMKIHITSEVELSRNIALTANSNQPDRSIPVELSESDHIPQKCANFERQNMTRIFVRLLMPLDEMCTSIHNRRT